MADVIGMAGLEELETYISRRNYTTAQYISTWPLLDLFLEAEKRPGAQMKNGDGNRKG